MGVRMNGAKINSIAFGIIGLVTAVFCVEGRSAILPFYGACLGMIFGAIFGGVADIVAAIDRLGNVDRAQPPVVEHT